MQLGRPLGLVRGRLWGGPGVADSPRVRVLALGRVPRQWLRGCARLRAFPPSSDSSDNGRERAPRARLAAGTRAVASADRSLGGLARPRPRLGHSPHVPREPAPSDHAERDHSECDHDERGHAHERQPSSPRLRQTTQAQAAQSVRARGSRCAPSRRP